MEKNWKFRNLTFLAAKVDSLLCLGVIIERNVFPRFTLWEALALEETSGRILYLFTDLLLPLVVGYLLHQKGLAGGRFIDGLIFVNIRFLITLLSLLSFWVLPITWELVWIPLFGALFVLLPLLISLPVALHRHKKPLNRGAYLISVMLANIGTIGGVCAFILYSEIGIAYSQLVGACQNVLLMLLCFPLAQYFHEKHVGVSRRHKMRWRDLRDKFLNWNQVGLLGMVAGAALNLCNIPRPDSVGPVFQWLVHISAWISLLPVGCLIDFHRAACYIPQVLDFIPLRFLVLPAVLWGSAHLAFSDPILLGSLLIFSAAPTAINAVITSQLYKLNVNLAIANFLLTTGLFLLVVFPLLYCFLS